MYCHLVDNFITEEMAGQAWFFTTIFSLSKVKIKVMIRRVTGDLLKGLGLTYRVSVGIV